jgi:signal transduction histidine kinase
MYNRYKFGKRSNRELAMVNTELQQTVQNLQTTRSQLVQSEKMAALGQLTAGIAHEIQNPLNFVNNFAEGAKELLKEFEETESDEERKELTAELEQSLQKIHDHGKRAERIVKSMLQHSRQGNGEMILADLNILLRDAVNLAYHGMRATHKDFQCTLEESLHPDLSPVFVVPEELNRVFLNISNNAFYAMRQKTLREQGYNPRLTFSTSVYGDHAFVRIKDNGDGIPKDVAEKIFQPFFTTKPSGQGTGLGLSMSYDIITRHGGRLTLDSSPGEYTEFTIALPLKKAEPA